MKMNLTFGTKNIVSFDPNAEISGENLFDSNRTV